MSAHAVTARQKAGSRGGNAMNRLRTPTHHRGLPANWNTSPSRPSHLPKADARTAAKAAAQAAGRVLAQRYPGLRAAQNLRNLLAAAERAQEALNVKTDVKEGYPDYVTDLGLPNITISDGKMEGSYIHTTVKQDYALGDPNSVYSTLPYPVDQNNTTHIYAPPVNKVTNPNVWRWDYAFQMPRRGTDAIQIPTPVIIPSPALEPAVAPRTRHEQAPRLRVGRVSRVRNVGIAIDVHPDGRVTPTPRAQRKRKPPHRVKETKGSVGGASYDGLKAVADLLGETVEMLDVISAAAGLPKNLLPKEQVKLLFVEGKIAQVDFEELIKQLLLNEIEDRAYAALGDWAKKVTRDLSRRGFSDIGGLQTRLTQGPRPLT